MSQVELEQQQGSENYTAASLTAGQVLNLAEKHEKKEANISWYGYVTLATFIVYVTCFIVGLSSLSGNFIVCDNSFDCSVMQKFIIASSVFLLTDWICIYAWGPLMWEHKKKRIVLLLFTSVKMLLMGIISCFVAKYTCAAGTTTFTNMFILNAIYNIIMMFVMVITWLRKLCNYYKNNRENFKRISPNNTQHETGTITPPEQMV